MTKGDGRPCELCGTSEWYDNSNCKQCARVRVSQWRRDNPGAVRSYQQQYRLDNLEKAKERVRQWRRDNPDERAAIDNRRRTRKTKAGGSYTAAEWKALKKQYNGRCLCCGKKTKLTADHVIPVIAGGSSDISNIQPLCGPCNSSKKDKTIDYRTKPSILRWVQERLL